MPAKHGLDDPDEDQAAKPAMSLMRITTLAIACGLTGVAVGVGILLDVDHQIPTHLFSLLGGAAGAAWIGFLAAHCRDMALRHNDARHAEVIAQQAVTIERIDALEAALAQLQQAIAAAHEAEDTKLWIEAMRRDSTPTPRPARRASHLRQVDQA
jgi:hypothetical protein